jgi:uncharacterized protein
MTATLTKIPRMSILTLGVRDLKAATDFYQKVLGTQPNTSQEGVTFIELPGTWLNLFPIGELAKDISPEVPAEKGKFSGVTIACNARSKEEVNAILDTARHSGGKVVKEGADTFWGGYSGYFTDLDGFHWEVAWGPMFDFAADGALKWKK